MLDDDSKNSDKKPAGNGGGGFKVPMTLLAWAGITAAVVALMMMKGHYPGTAQPEAIQQSAFLQYFESNQIASATIVVNQQTLPLTDISGSYTKTDKDGKVLAEKDGKPVEFPFVVRNAYLSPEVWSRLLRSDLIKNNSPNVMLQSFLW